YVEPDPDHRDLHPCPTRRSSDLTPETLRRKLSTAHSRYAAHCARRSGRPSRSAGSSTWMIRMPAASRSVTSSRRARAIWRQVCRSEEHTSELQSREKLVCRLLLE